MKRNRFDLCLGNNCTECIGIDIKRIDKNRYLCKHTGYTLVYSRKREALIYCEK
ncbi:MULTISPECIES: hypothetical protein [unclassified Clostridium]|uniref:hypothetical protein n=1 Tax=unclassified Clostridium TaxID=2614128 RepID=UPI0025C718E2|nr:MULTISPECIES: hypothetical protein [unclassified Clostridium]